jgi:homoserine O-acetyltransferase/O-succinyltransferase
MRAFTLVTAAGLSISLPAVAAGQSQQRFADLGTCATSRGEVVRECRVGYRTFGRLNERRDNAVLVPTWHGGRSETMTFILGSDRWVDTTRYFAILVDKLGNGVSTSPSNSRSQPGKRFPRLTYGDMVAAQHRLVVEHLGLRKLHAVVGWSMGGMQALEWSLRFPAAVGRVVSVAGTPRMGTYELYPIRTMLTLLDLGGRSGLPADTLALHLAELWHTIATTPAQENLLSRDSVPAMIAAEARNDWIGLHPEDNRLQLEAVTVYDALAEVRRAGAASRPHTLLLFMPEDHVNTPESFREFARITGADTVAFSSRCGHLAPVCETEAIGAHVRRYLDDERDVATRR